MIILSSYVSNRFRWVFCQLDALRRCFPSNLRRTLKELPKSLDETYERVLKDINNANWEHAYRLLQCLTVACRPLRVEELAEVLTFDLTEGVSKPILDWRWEDREEAVLSACSSLVSVINDNGFRVVQFSHFSVKEFLTSERLNGCVEEESRFYIPMEPSHTILAQACLGVLRCLDDHTDQGRAENIPLFRYAAEYWYQHARIGNVELEIADAMDCFFDTDKPHFSAWVRLQGRANLGIPYIIIQSRNMPDSVLPLCVAAGHGFRDLVERRIIKHPQQVDRFDGTFGTPLHASVIGGGHSKVAQLLLERGANINSCTPHDATPLYIASQLGLLEIGKWLLDHGADVNRRMKNGSTSPYMAVENRDLEATRLLLKREAISQADDRSTPLLSAFQKKSPPHLPAGHHHVDVSRKLFKPYYAKVNSRNANGSTPLHCALHYKNFDVVHLLLDHKADVHARDESGKIPLHLAAACGPLEVSRKLLELNSEVNSQDDEGSTPLHCALRNGNLNVVWLLLNSKQGPDVRCATHSEILHSILQQRLVVVSRRLLRNYLSSMRGLIPWITKDLLHFTVHCGTGISMLCGYC
jgi:ankyrin repeat protein